MELIWTAIVLGLVGSLHCAVMCGPLVLALSSTRARLPLNASRLVYHAGRIASYCAIGALFGAVGQTFALAGLQRWTSIIAGVAILLGLLFSSRAGLNSYVMKMVMTLKGAFARLLERRTLASQFLLGTLNGLLPCGLVYIAAAGATTTLSPVFGALHMAAFGLGTLPMLLGVAVLGRKLRVLNPHAPRLIPIFVAAVAILLVVRGMALGIPYFSPALNAAGATVCH